MFFELKGRVIPTSSACTSGSQAIGYGYESIKYGRQTMMLCGGAEELSGPGAAVFDTLFATSTRNDEPAHDAAPVRPRARRPGGRRRRHHAGAGGIRARPGARRDDLRRGDRLRLQLRRQPHHPATRETMATAMQWALDDAGIGGDRIGYVSAHGTATDRGDVAESHATASMLGSQVPVSSMKSYVGHTLGACGALESWWAIRMMRGGWFAPTINLVDIDPECAELDYITGDGRRSTPIA